MKREIIIGNERRNIKKVSPESFDLYPPQQGSRGVLLMEDDHTLVAPSDSILFGFSIRPSVNVRIKRITGFMTVRAAGAYPQINCPFVVSVAENVNSSPLSTFPGIVGTLFYSPTQSTSFSAYSENGLPIDCNLSLSAANGLYYVQAYNAFRAWAVGDVATIKWAIEWEV
jgi:hypothetical protein